MTDAKRSWYKEPSFLVGVIAFLLFSGGTIGTEITKIDVRFALFVDDMAKYGLHLFPTLNGEPYTDYPVLMTLFAYLTSLGGRFLNLWTLLLPAMLFGAYTVAMTCRIGEKIRSGLGLTAACLSFLCMEYLFIFMSFGIDVPVAACGVTMLYLIEFHRDRIGSWLVVFPLLLAFAFCIRGPLGLILVGAAVAGYLFAVRDWKNILKYGICGGISAVLCAGIGYYLVRIRGGEELWQAFLEWQISSRMSADDLFFYVLDGPIVFAPATFLTIAALVLTWKKWKKTPLLRWGGFIVLPLILLSIPGCKHLRYMTITIPAFTLAGAWSLRCCADRPLWRKCVTFVLYWARKLVPLLVLISVLCLALGTLAYGILDTLLAKRQVSVMPFYYELALKVLLAAIPLSLIYAYFRRRRSCGNLASLMALALSAGCLLTLCIFPMMTLRENSRPFVQTAEKVRMQERGKLYFYRIGPDHEELKYIICMNPEQRQFVRYLRNSRQNDKYRKMFPPISPAEGLKQITPQDVVILKEGHEDRLRKDLNPLGLKSVCFDSGMLGHRMYYAVHIVPVNR